MYLNLIYPMVYWLFSFFSFFLNAENRTYEFRILSNLLKSNFKNQNFEYKTAYDTNNIQKQLIYTCA